MAFTIMHVLIVAAAIFYVAGTAWFLYNLWKADGP
jgi:hypothetical protein